MGLFKGKGGIPKSMFTEMGGLGIPEASLEQGLAGRGEVVSVEETGINISHGVGGGPSPICDVTVRVLLDNVAPYQATRRQGVPLTLVPQLQTPGAVIAVRVNPNDPADIALDIGAEPPSVTLAADPTALSAADILTRGVPARAVIVQSTPQGYHNAAGVDIYGFTLTVMIDGRTAYQAKVGNPVPVEAVPLLFPGANLPAKVLADNDDAVAIDWTAGLEESKHSSH